jgi:hypothetical protein
MGFTVWDRVKGGPANPVRYWTKRNAEKARDRFNAKAGETDRYYVKEL